MPKRYPIKQKKPCFTYNHDNIKCRLVEHVYHVYWSLEKKKNKIFLRKIRKWNKCQIYKAEKTESDIFKAENSGRKCKRTIIISLLVDPIYIEVVTGARHS